MGALATRGTHTVIKSLGGELMAIPFQFETGDTSGLEPTLTHDFNGSISVAITEDATDLYVFDIGSYKKFITAYGVSTSGATVNITPSGSAADGTVTLSVANEALANATVSGCIWVIK